MKKKHRTIKRIMMITMFACLSLKSQGAHVNAQDKTNVVKKTIEQQLFGKDTRQSIDVSKYQLKEDQAKKIVTGLQKDYGAAGLMKCTYKTNEDGIVSKIKVQTDESYQSVIKQVNELDESSDDSGSVDDSKDDSTDNAQEQLKQQVISDYAELQKYFEDNPDYFGVAVPYFTDKDTEETPLGAIIELADLDEDNLDMEQLDQTICGIKQALEMYVQYYGEDLLKIKDEILAKTDDQMTEIEKLLVVYDELARRATFDTDYLEKTGNGGGGLLSSTAFGALNQGKAICLGYAAAYGYLVQNMYPEIYKHEDGTWKTKEEVGDDYMIDYAKYIKGNPHYMNVIKLEGKWYYLDPSFDDIKFDQVVLLRTQTDGNCSHQFFLYTQEDMEKWLNIKESVIDSAYKDKCVNTTYKNEWYSHVTSELSYDDDHWYYVLPQVDTTNVPEEEKSYHYIDKKDQLTMRDRKTGELQTLIDYESGQVYKMDGTLSETNEELKEEYQKDIDYNKIYPALQHSVSLYNGSLYFNMGNKIYKYSLEDASITKIKEYNKLYVKQDENVTPVREAFFLTDKAGDNTNFNFTERPIAGISIKNDGKMYVALATNLTGKYSYESEAVNFIPYYGYFGESIRYSMQFRKCANVKETIDMQHLESDEHEYETVHVDPTCIRKGFTEERCKICGKIKEGTRKETSDIVDHHYVYDSNSKKYRCTYCNHVTSSSVKVHQYDQRPKFYWSDDKETCQAEFVCSVCGNVEKVDCKVTSKIVKESNCLEQGIKEYRAECTFQGNSCNDGRVKMLPKSVKKVMLKMSTMNLYVTEGKKIELNSNYPGDTVTAVKVSKSGIIRVSGDQIYGVKTGKVTVTVTTKSKVNLKCTVTVTKPPITLSKKTITLLPKKTYKLTVSKKIATDKVSKWTTSNKKIATVDKNGKITAKAAGTCYITVTMKSGTTSKAKVVVQKKIAIKTLKANTKTVTLKIEKTYQLIVKKTPVTANEEITYKTSNSKVATVSSQGKITAKAKGNCTITIKGGTKSVTVKVIVK